MQILLTCARMWNVMTMTTIHHIQSVVWASIALCHHQNTMKPTTWSPSSGLTVYFKASEFLIYDCQLSKHILRMAFKPTPLALPTEPHMLETVVDCYTPQLASFLNCRNDYRFLDKSIGSNLNSVLMSL